jgi:thiamine pyrophosphate-dependent acetolactate synthase large subunit-like protein
MASLIHAYVAAQSKPCAPTYVCLDVGLQEDAVEASAIEFPDTQRYLDAIDTPGPSSDVVSQIVRALDAAKKPLFMFGRTGTSRASWQQRIALAEKFDARVSTDLKQIAAFPTHHRLHASPPAVFLAPETSALIRAADLILSFDWVDLAGSLKAAVWSGPATVIHVSLDAALHNGWSKDHFALPPADMVVRADVDETVAAVLRAVDARPDRASGWPPASDRACGLPPASPVESDDIFMPDLARALYSAVSPDEICLVRVPLGWVGRDLRTTHPLSFL